VAPPRDARKLRIARWAEGAYALSALVVAAALPTPGAHNAREWVHWLGTAILAGLLTVKLRRPNHATWWIAAILAAYVLGAALLAALRTGGRLLPTAPVAIAIYAVVLGSQLAVAVGLSGLRQLRHEKARR